MINLSNARIIYYIMIKTLIDFWEISDNIVL